MTVNPTKPAPLKEKTFMQRLISDFQKHKYKYLLILPIIIYLLLFCYKPMYGLIIAFKNYRPTRGIWDSKWVGFMWFETFFKDPYFWRLLRNTFSISGLTILFGFPAPILLALLLNEVHNNKFKRTVQTITYMPYFISLVVTCSLIKIYTMENGLFPIVMGLFGVPRQNLLANPGCFYPIYILSDIWQGIGWNSIIYLAALSGIDQEQYEAAKIDGPTVSSRCCTSRCPACCPPSPFSSSCVWVTFSTLATRRSFCCTIPPPTRLQTYCPPIPIA